MSGQDRPPRRPGTVSGAGRAHLRTDRLDEREREADRREALADDREALANDRESQANLRDKWLAEREREVDQREGLADDREALANDRESQANLREKRLDKREGSLNDLQRQLAGTIEHTRAVLAAEQQHRNPLQAAGADPGISTQGMQAEVGEDSADSEGLSARLIVFREQMVRAQTLRRQTAAVIEALAATEERIARQHDQMAAVATVHADKYRRFADDARAAAERVRAIVRNWR